MKTKVKEDDHGRSQAKAQLESVIEMVERLKHGEDDALEAIQEDPLTVEVKSDWHSPGDKEAEDTDYLILLCTGGPAVRITGTLDKWKQPETATIEYQDWFTPWNPYPTTQSQVEALLDYARCFYFGE